MMRAHGAPPKLVRRVAGRYRPIADLDEEALFAHADQVAQRGTPMAVRSRVRTMPRSLAKATARPLSGGFGPPARRSASARSRSRLRILGSSGVVGRREIENS